ncbi:hypothetical protein, partial [Pseudomonas aeruginosa]
HHGIAGVGQVAIGESEFAAVLAPDGEQIGAAPGGGQQGCLDDEVAAGEGMAYRSSARNA